MRRGQPRSDDEYAAYEGVLIHGDISAIGHPYEPTDEEADVMQHELEEKLARKRQPGFTARWDDDARV